MKKHYFVLLFAAFAVSLQAVTFSKSDNADFEKMVAGDQVVVTISYDGTVYALNGDDATGKSPVPDVITPVEDAIANPDGKYVFFVEPAEGGYIFTREDGKQLYMVSANKDGIRVGTPSKSAAFIWNYDEEHKHFYAELNGTKEYLGIYRKADDASDFKVFCHYAYSASKTSNYYKMIQDEEFALYVYSPTGDPSQPKYDITVDKVEGGTLAVAYPKAGKGAVIEVSVSAEKGYDYVEGSLALVYNDGEKDVAVAVEDNQFLMQEYAVTVTAEFEGHAPKATIDFTDSANPWKLPKNRTLDKQSFSYDGMTISIVGTGNIENNGGYALYTWGGSYLLFGKKNAAISLPVFDYNVSKIVVTGHPMASEQDEMNIMVDGKAVSTATVGSVEENTYIIQREARAAGTQYDLTVLSDHAARVTTIDVYDIVPGAPEVPDVSVPGGLYKSAQSVALSCYTEGAAIHYTLDGSRPTESSPAYSSIIPVDKTMTIRAIAVKDGVKSDIMTVHYAIANVSADGTNTNPYSVADVHQLGNPGWKAWVHGYIINGFEPNIKIRTLSGESTNAIAIADSKDETDPAKMTFVELPQGKIRTYLNVVSNPENIGKEVWVYGVLSNYGGQPGVSKTSKYYLDEMPVPTSLEQVGGDTMPSEAAAVVKILRDGQIRINRCGQIYTITGQRME